MYRFPLISFISVMTLSSVHSSSHSQANKGHGNVIVRGDGNKIHLASANPNSDADICWKPIQSSLPLPADSILLERAGLIERLKEYFNSNTDISTVALVGVIGMGGVGKTTLARLWATKRIAESSAVTVWEFNAETEATLLQSMKEFSTRLAQTADQKRELQQIEDIKDPNERESKRLVFVQDVLRVSEGWVLIYDNVERYGEIQKYLPQASNLWGKGQVILTTRNAQIKNVGEKIITLEDLTPDEALTLYSRIRYHKEPSQLTSKETEDAKVILKRVPPFPLDISIAANYIGNYKLSPSEYLAALDKQDASFLEVQQELLKDGGDYTKTQYEIITLSLKKIIESDKENLQKLLMLSMMDSQNIPKDMLNKTSQGVTASGKADKFIREMMKHSLITMGMAPGDIGTISLHRSTWEIMYAYLVNTLKLSQSHPVVRNVIRSMADYVYSAIDEEKLSVLRLLEPHGKRISTSELLTIDEQMKVTGMLGCIYCYAFNRKEAQELLEKSIKYIEHNLYRDNNRLARLYMHLGMIYQVNCKYFLAKTYLEKAIKGYTLSKNISGCIDSICLLAHTFYVTGDLLKAKELLKKIEAIHHKDKTSAEDLILRIASLIERELGNMSIALEAINESIVKRKALNKLDQFQAWNILYKGVVLKSIGDYATANEWADKGDILYSEYDSTSKMYACVKLYRGGIYRLMGNYKEAEKWLRFALKICEQDAAENPMEIGCGKTLLAKVYRNTGYLDKAFTEATAAEKLYIDLFGEKNLRTSWIRMTIGQLYNDQGKYSEAKDIFQECLDVHKSILKDTHPKIGKILSELGYAQVNLGNIKEGHTNLEIGLKNYEAHYGKDHLRTAYVLRLISESLQIQGDLNGAEAAAQRSYTICQNADHPDQILSLERLGDVRIKAGSSQGNSDLKKALGMAETTFGTDSHHVKRIKEKL